MGKGIMNKQYDEDTRYWRFNLEVEIKAYTENLARAIMNHCENMIMGRQNVLNVTHMDLEEIKED